MFEGHILIVDDEDDTRFLFSRILEKEGFKTLDVPNERQAFKVLQKDEVDIILCDVNLAETNGLELLKRFKETCPLVEVIMLTAYGSIKDGVTAIKAGAYDYIIKGEDNSKLIPLLYRAYEKVKLQKKIKKLEEQVGDQYSFSSVIGKSAQIKEAIEMARRVAATDATVLLLGETGTGKEVFARAIHSASHRSDKAFVAINCSAFNKELLESELFGHKAGSFTGATYDKKGLFEEASGGTIFLDEIGEMNLDLQAKLLRVLETSTFIKVGDTKTSKVDVRIIAATNRNLLKDENKFRSDLYYRLSVFEIMLPPLRDRQSDIPLLAEHFMQLFARNSQKKFSGMTDGFLQHLVQYPWKGNIRELRNVVERAVILSEGGKLEESVLPYEVKFGPSVLEVNNSNKLELGYIEKMHIERVLKIANGNKTQAARLLNIGVSTLYRKISEYEIQLAENGVY
ncbi:sigma-54-dependent transcriptional regulator [Nafulsella turpanensis]|uniref:sigma-54-dependent transcriptional regulator n=1 Tax=Nafulsella turpanensis TaxID=1265690 RepID=UPI00047757C4|nr:sigma-54 dependent transcriptional regulator [Nafulsella turpanensis]